MKRRVGIPMLVLVVGAAPVTIAACTAVPVAVACDVGTHHPSGQRDVCVTNATPATRASLLATARQTARANHGVAQRVVAVESAVADVNAFLNVRGFSPGDQGEWVVQVSGRFRCGSACFSPPPSGQPPQRVLTVVIDPTTLGVTGLGIGNDWVDLSKIGTEVVLQD